MSDTPTAETPSTETPPPAAAAESTPPPASSSAGNGAAGSATPDFSDIAAVLKEKPSALSPEDALETIEASGKEGTPTAETIIGIIQTALVLIGDDEGILTETEKMILRGPLDRVLKKYKIGDDVMPPEVDLAFALAGLVIVRLKKPKTATFAAKCRAWIVGMWFNQKGRTLAAKIDREASAR